MMTPVLPGTCPRPELCRPIIQAGLRGTARLSESAAVCWSCISVCNIHQTFLRSGFRDFLDSCSRIQHTPCAGTHSCRGYHLWPRYPNIWNSSIGGHLWDKLCSCGGPYSKDLIFAYMKWLWIHFDIKIIKFLFIACIMYLNFHLSPTLAMALAFPWYLAPFDSWMTAIRVMNVTEMNSTSTIGSYIALKKLLFFRWFVFLGAPFRVTKFSR